MEYRGGKRDGLAKGWRELEHVVRTWYIENGGEGGKSRVGNVGDAARVFPVGLDGGRWLGGL